MTKQQKRDNEWIETNGYNALERELIKSSYLSPDLKKRDKYPVWDGDILVYKKPGKKNRV